MSPLAAERPLRSFFGRTLRRPINLPRNDASARLKRQIEWLKEIPLTEFRVIAMKYLCLLIVLLLSAAATSYSADWQVDPVDGDDSAAGSGRAVKSIARAIRLANAGDTIHLRPMVYHDWAPFYDKAGEPERPIVLDGHGATLDGCDRLETNGWVDLGQGLFRHDDLLPLTDAIIDRWFFVWDGKLNRMRRCSKGPSEPLKSPESLVAGEWTFVKDAERTKAARAGYIHGSFFVRLPRGQKLSEADIQIPNRPAGVLIHGKSRHLVVRNLTATHVYNDGFNLSDCQDVVFENIRAIDCGDDGIGAHGACRYRVDGLTSIGNATGICDTGDSETSYRRVLIDRCIGFDLFFLDTGRYSVSDAHIRSMATRPLYLQGRDVPAAPCRVTLNNIWLERFGGVAEVRVSPNCRLTAARCTFSNLDWQAVGGELSLERCVIGGTVPAEPPRAPNLHLWPDARWTGRNNLYGFSGIRVGQRSFARSAFDDFVQTVASDQGSRWIETPPNSDAESGARLDHLPKMPSP
jgi:hypothetical protein